MDKKKIIRVELIDVNKIDVMSWLRKMDSSVTIHEANRVAGQRFIEFDYVQFAVEFFDYMQYRIGTVRLHIDYTHENKSYGSGFGGPVG